MLRGAFLLSGLLLSGAVGATPDSAWTRVATPNSPPTPASNYQLGVACVTTADCWAVGYYVNAGSFQTLIRHWDGTAWTIVESPNTSFTLNNMLRSVVCLSAVDCWAVGSYSDGSYQRSLALHWDGSAWSQVPVPATGASEYNQLLDVACASATDCWAVGYASGSTHRTLVQRWNGSAWSLVTSPNATGSSESILFGVACVTATDCWAVGHGVNPASNFSQTLIQRWNGVVWSAVVSPNALPSTHNHLYDITCRATTDCWAVGSANNGSVEQTLVQRWNGTAWTVVSSPNSALTQDNRLDSVSCVTATDCWAVGSFNEGIAGRTLAARWNGSAWAIVATPNIGAEANRLTSMACGGGACRAVGDYGAGGVQQTLMAHWNGSAWSSVPSPNGASSQNNTLLGVGCVSPEDCWAVGSYFSGIAQQNQIQHWDGQGWSKAVAPNTNAFQGQALYDVACLSGVDCWAVGRYQAAAGWQTLAARWNGVTWSIVTTPNARLDQNNFLERLSCVSSADCWAVGFYDTGLTYQTLALHWDGAQWAVVESANADPSRQNRLAGVACAASNDCWAVGRYFNGTTLRTLVQHWDGNAWSVVTSPNTAEFEVNQLHAVDCVSTNDCWAVGTWGADAATAQPMIQHWDGSAWSIVSSPEPTQAPSNYNFLRDIRCLSAADCHAVGYSFRDGVYQTLIEHWDGSVWQIVESPNSSADQNNYLFGVSCATKAACRAVGYHFDERAVLQTMAAHYFRSAAEVEPFQFIVRTGVAQGVYVTSETKVMRGAPGPWPVSIDSGGQISINGGGYATAGSIADGQTLRVRHVSSVTPGGEKISTVRVGDFETSFKTVTGNADRVPDAFSFGSKTGQPRGVIVESEPIQLTGYDVEIAMQPGPGIAYSLDGGASWSTTSGTLAPPLTPCSPCQSVAIRVRHTSNASALGYTKTHLRIGGMVGYFTTRSN